MRLRTLPALLLVALFAPRPSAALTQYCVDSVGELREALDEAETIDDTLWIKVERGSYLLTAPIVYDGFFDRELQVLGGYGNDCVGRISDPAETVLFYPNASTAAVANIDFQLRTWGRVVVRWLTFREIDDVHVILKGDDAEARIDANRFESTGGLSFDAHYIHGDAAESTLIEVYNNVILDTPYEDGLRIRPGIGGGVRVMYNTIVGSEGENLSYDGDWDEPNSVRISSNIFWGDSVTDVDIDETYIFTFERNIYRDFDQDPCPGGTPGVVTLCFRSTPGTNFRNLNPDLDSDGRTMAGSPAIDRGEHAGTPIGIAYDAVGSPRFRGDRTDLGAFEIE
jgi:hypothetical protein